MKPVRIIGGGWYGCHLAAALSGPEGSVTDLQLLESAGQLFAGASGGNPARLHKGFHYPRSKLTRNACASHAWDFLDAYGHLTRAVPVNLYAVAAEDSLIDFGTYRETMKASGLEFLSVRDPTEFGLRGIEGALLTAERHIVIDLAREHFTERLVESGIAKLNAGPVELDDPRFFTIDCTFCALDAQAVDRYEPCLTVLLEGPTDRAVTIMDGPFPSIYPWNEAAGLSSLTSARWTPLTKECRTWAEANALLQRVSPAQVAARAHTMFDQIGAYWPAALDLYKIADHRLTIRAMPKSGADARLVDLVRTGPNSIRLRAGKIDAVFRAEALVREEMAKCS